MPIGNRAPARRGAKKSHTSHDLVIYTIGLTQTRHNILCSCLVLICIFQDRDLDLPLAGLSKDVMHSTVLQMALANIQGDFSVRNPKFLNCATSAEKEELEVF